MELKKISLEDTHSFTPFFLDYLKEKDHLKPFYHRFPTIQNAKQQLTEKSKSFSTSNRSALVGALQKQYGALKSSAQVKENIEALKSEKTFTITTGHQLNIFTGPLYFIYKIVTVINSCKELKKAYPEFNFVPVYWMASEDHDYDEIKSFRLYGKKYSWNTEQQGAVGRFSTTGLDTLANDLPGDVQIFKDAYLKNQRLSDAVRHYVNALFQQEGLVVIDADDHDLKALFKTVIHKDVIECSTLPLVEKTNKKLEDLTYKTQVYCRDINFFYLDNGVRARIEKEDNRYKVVDTKLSFSESEMKGLIEQSPEKFSPNVILRPLYQEVILPNIAYVGGPAEVIYWLQLKSVFDNHRVTFPMLMPRNFAMVMEHHIARKFEKTELSLQQLFEDKNSIFNGWVLKNTRHNLTVSAERDALEKMFSSLKERAESIDKTLGQHIAAEGTRASHSLENIERKLIRAEKRLHKEKLGQIESVKDALFPNGGLQERTDNFLNFYQQDAGFIQHLLNTFEPFDYRFNVLSYSS